MSVIDSAFEIGKVDNDLVHRFQSECERLYFSAELGLAVSGGPDSMALLALAASSHFSFFVATVDHGLRPESADECAMVAEVCAAFDIECKILTVEVKKGNVQQEARNARYAALQAWASDRDIHTLVTAHHADDQAETVLMRLNRSSGVGGLAGIRSMRILDDDLRLIRPLLGFRRSELMDVLRQAGLPHIEDPSNADDRYDRVRMRKAIADADWLDPVAIARAAENFAEADTILNSVAKDVWSSGATAREGEITVPFAPWFDTNARNVLRAIEGLGGRTTYGEVRALVIRLVGDGAKSNLGGVMVEKRALDYLCRPEPPRKTG